ncbi:MAG TPA: phenylalanine--tRNA ligase subunit alpha [Candidatus Avidehalobacter gallistercoris]|uniref:Phenylalanine--tRNA ligase alpha subunit n=1 Tax=Candidatus Avidehalobacter gallistercoris TaxID=2840694 RepID=A0A9D1HL00_9FIRM|nr:phenylalanine--tRNA ligase subunit alpha [Candidatus Avidehalobacter gallistercoris]
MLEKIKEIREAMERELREAVSSDQLRELKVKYLGKKGSISELSKGMGKLLPEERPKAGQLVNELRQALEDNLAAKQQELADKAMELKMAQEKVDVTLPGRPVKLGSRHPLTLVTDELKEIFLGMGYTVEEGPQVELDYYNFERMNLPADHPARDMQDSFYFDAKRLLRTHTSPVQARTMDKLCPQAPIKMISPGAVYRRDDDATHSPMFHQVEGLVVDEGISLADLKGTLLNFVRQMFGEEREIRLRPSFFPFTEPSVEVDISCMLCGGKGCRTCKDTGWIEILGAGMVHPNVLKMSGYDPERYTGFAFGCGIERIAMLKYGIDDLRVMFENDVRFLQKF